MNTQLESDSSTKNEISQAIKKLDNILSSGIFSPNITTHPLLEASFAYTLILLRDLIFKANQYGTTKVTFTDDVALDSKVKDIGGLIKYVRDAICHLDSKNHYLTNKTRASFNIAVGKCNLMKVDDIEIKSSYEDDICYFFGDKGIYLNRHIKRAFEEAKTSLKCFI